MEYMRNWKHGGSKKFWAKTYTKSVYLQSILAIYFPVDAVISLVGYISLAHGFHVFYTASFWMLLSLTWALPPCFFVLHLYLQKRRQKKKKIYHLDDDLKDDYERDILIDEDDNDNNNNHHYYDHNRIINRGINNDDIDEGEEDEMIPRKREKKDDGFALDFIAEGYVEHRFVPTMWNGLGISACVFGVLSSIMGCACNFIVKDVAGGLAALVTLFTVIGCMYYIIHRSLDPKESPEMEMEMAREETEQARQIKTKVKKIKDFSKRLCSFVVGVIVVMVTILAGLQSFVYAFNVHYYPPPGQLVNIGGSRVMHMTCNGTIGGPTVIFLHGWGGQAYDWSWIQPGVSQFARTCAVDRAGYGWSDPPKCVLCARTAEQQAKDLDALLRASNMDKDNITFVVYGDAVLDTRVFVNKYKYNVCGIVCVDCVDPAKFRKVGAHATYDTPPFWDLWRNVLPSGIPGVLAAINKLPGFEIINTLPNDIHPIYVQNQLKPVYPQTVVKEYESRPKSAQQAIDAGDFGSIRLTVLIAGRGFNASGVTSLSTNYSFLNYSTAPYDMHYHKVYANDIVAQISTTVSYCAKRSLLLP